MTTATTTRHKIIMTKSSSRIKRERVAKPKTAETRQDGEEDETNKKNKKKKTMVMVMVSKCKQNFRAVCELDD